MKTLMIFAAVLLVSEAAKVPQVSLQTVTHQVSVVVPPNVLAAPIDSDAVPDVPAVVVEVAKDHVHEPDMPVMVVTPVDSVVDPNMPEVVKPVDPNMLEVVKPVDPNMPEVVKPVDPNMPETEKPVDHVNEPDMPEVTTAVDELEEVTVTVSDNGDVEVTTVEVITDEKPTTIGHVTLETDKVVRKTRAIPYTETVQIPGKVQPKLTTDVNVIRAILSQRKKNMMNQHHRSMRAVDEEMVSQSQEPVTDIAAKDTPISDMPVSVMPDTDMPVSEMPVSEIPDSDMPDSDVPVSDVPASDMPVSVIPVSDMPATEMPATEMPITALPVSVIPVTNLPASAKNPEISTIDPCDLLCTKFEFDPVCATNTLCLHEFPNQCILDTYNCKHPNMQFSATKDDRCQMHWLTKCDESEMI